MTATAPRGYMVAGHFRKKGAQVVIGGMPASVLPEEAQQHAHAVRDSEVIAWAWPVGGGVQDNQKLDWVQQQPEE